MRQLDKIDRRILRELQRDARLQNIELAQRVGLSPSPCLRRVKLLEAAGVIERYAAVLNASKIGLKLSVFVRVWLRGQDAATVRQFAAEVRRLREVVECHLMAGDCDFLLRVVVADLETYRKFQADLTGIKAVQRVRMEIPMQSLKRVAELPV